MSSIADSRARTRTRREPQRTPSAQAPRRPYFEMNGAIIVSIAAVVLTIIGMLYLIQTSEVADLGYQMSRSQTQREELTLEISELKSELARYESLHTIERVAEGELGMVPLNNYDFIEVQRPAEAELDVPTQEPTEQPSLFERALDAILGVGTAHATKQSTDEVAP